jgi:hypothetical protein
MSISDSNSNVVVGRNSTAIGNLIDGGNNLILGNDITVDSAGPFDGRMYETERSIVIGNGPIRGIREDNGVLTTTALTVVPDGATVIGFPLGVPVEADNSGATLADATGHLIINALAPIAAVGATVVDVLVPIYYRGHKYYFHATSGPVVP